MAITWVSFIEDGVFDGTTEVLPAGGLGPGGVTNPGFVTSDVIDNSGFAITEVHISIVGYGNGFDPTRVWVGWLGADASGFIETPHPIGIMKNDDTGMNVPATTYRPASWTGLWYGPLFLTLRVRSAWCSSFVVFIRNNDPKTAVVPTVTYKQATSA